MKQALFQFAPVFALGAGVLLISGMREQFVMPPVKPMASMTNTIVGMKGRDLVIDDDQRRVAGMSHYVMREFGPDSAATFSAYVGYYDRQVQGKTIHSPKNCLPGAGWEVLNSSSVPIINGKLTGAATRVLLANRGATALVYYWYQGRGRIEASEYRVKWDLLRDAALYGRTEEALVRIVIPLESTTKGATHSASDATVKEADALAKRIAQELAVAVDGVMPRGPFGT